MKKIRKTKNRIGIVGHIVNNITSTKEDETLNVKSIIDYVNNSKICTIDETTNPSNWNELYRNGPGIKVYKILYSTTNKPIGMPKNAYVGGILLCIFLEKNSNRYYNCQIYITDGLHNTDSTTGVFIRTREGSWIKLSSVAIESLTE